MGTGARKLLRRPRNVHRKRLQETAMHKQSVVREKKGTRHWRGALTIQRIVTLKQELFQALDELDRILLALSEGSSVNPARLQLLCSAHRAAAQLAKELALAGSGGDHLTGRENFVRHVGCTLECSRDCLWGDNQESALQQKTTTRLRPQKGGDTWPRKS